MKNIKKLAALFLAVVLTLCFAACGSKDTTSDTSNVSSEAKVELTTVTEGVLTMATNPNFPPYEYKEGDKVVGIDAEIAELIANKLGLKLEIAEVDFGSIIPGVQTGKYDMGMAGITVKPEREKMVNFTSTYAKGVQVVIVPENSEIKSVDDIMGHKIGVQANTTGHIYASDTPENGGFGEENVVPYNIGGMAVEALKKGKVDCVIIDNEPAKAFVKANEGLKILDSEYTQEDYAICTSKENPELLNAINKALEELIADGSVQAILDKYIKAE